MRLYRLDILYLRNSLIPSSMPFSVLFCLTINCGIVFVFKPAAMCNTPSPRCTHQYLNPVGNTGVVGRFCTYTLAFIDLIAWIMKPSNYIHLSPQICQCCVLCWKVQPYRNRTLDNHVFVVYQDFTSCIWYWFAFVFTIDKHCADPLFSSPFAGELYHVSPLVLSTITTVQGV